MLSFFLDFSYPPHPYLNPLRHHPHSTANVMDERYFEPPQHDMYESINQGYASQDPWYQNTYRDGHSMGRDGYYEDTRYNDTHQSTRGSERYNKGDSRSRYTSGSRCRYGQDDRYNGYHSDGDTRTSENRYNRLRRKYIPERNPRFDSNATEHVYPRQYPNRLRFRVSEHNPMNEQPYRPTPLHGRFSGSLNALPTMHSHAACCPMCGGTGMHSHGSYVYPSPSTKPITQPQHVTYMRPNPSGSSHITPLNTTLDTSQMQPGQIFVPATNVTTNTAPIQLTTIPNGQHIPVGAAQNW